MNQCPKCGAVVKDGQKFCVLCGCNLAAAQAEAEADRQEAARAEAARQRAAAEPTLRKYLEERGRLPVREALAILEPVIQQLMQMNASGRVYGHVNPDHIVFGDGGQARLKDPQQLSAVFSENDPYLAFEQVAENRTTEVSDLYAFCAVVYRCITGTEPPCSRDRAAQDTLTIPPMEDLYYQQVLKVGMSVKTEGRFKNISALKNALYRNMEHSEDKTMILSPSDDRTEILTANDSEMRSGSQVPPARIPSDTVHTLEAFVSVQSDAKKKKKKNGTAIIVVLMLIIAVIVLGTGIFLFLFVRSGKTLSDFLPVSSRESETEGEEGFEGGTADAEQMLAEADALAEEAAFLMSGGDTILDAKGKVLEAVDVYLQAAEEDSDLTERIQKNLDSVITNYAKVVVDQVDMLYEQDPQKEVYTQITMTLDEALEEKAKIEEAGFTAEMAEVEEYRANCAEEYKKVYIEYFNGFMEEYNWNVRHNEEVTRGARELFPSDDADDPINLRYSYAYAWLVHQEVVEGMNDGTIDAAAAVDKIINALPQTDYCEFLIREAEVYAWQAGIADSAYFGTVSGGPILQDSSSKEYTMQELVNMSTAELRMARVEIYDRHKVTEENMYKFMAYNDFGTYSPDPSNGLTTTERHNIRTIVETEMQKGGFIR